jgi:hypothetical protein
MKLSVSLPNDDVEFSITMHGRRDLMLEVNEALRLHLAI